MNRVSFKRIISLIAACAVMLVLSHSAVAQAPTVSLNAKDITVKELLKSIEKECGYTFAYVNSEVNLNKVVSVKAENESVLTVISKVLPEMNLEIKNKQIIMTLKTSAGKTAPRQNASDLTRHLTGVVTDQDGEPVVGAMVMLAGTQTGTVTDLDGKYSLEINKKKAVLEVSSIGYKTTHVQLNDFQVIADVVMPVESILLDDVVVVGYGVQNKRDVTTSIVSIKSDDFKTMPTADFRDAMAAKMPGVQVTSIGGQPDGNVVVRVRGIQSANSGNDPLYVIDGIPCDSRGFANLDSSEIESLEVLKDASAAAIYGSRGSCGVIIITTKRGSKDVPVISYDGQMSVSEVSKTIEMLDAYEFAQIIKESRDGCYLLENPAGSIGDAYGDRPQTYHRVDPHFQAYWNDETGSLPNTDWQDEIFRTALSHKHALNVSGKNKSLKYYIGANYLYREGTILGSDFQRYGVRMNLDGGKGKLKYGMSIAPSYSKTNYVASDAQYNSDGVVSSALMTPANFLVYNEDGSYNWDMNGAVNVGSVGNMQLNATLNPVALALEIDDIRTKMNVVGNAYASYEFIKGLQYKILLGGDYYGYSRNYYRPSYIPNQGNKYGSSPSTPIAKSSRNTYVHWTVSNQLSFNRKFGDHSINAVAAYEAEQETTETIGIVATGVIGDDKIRTTKGKTIDPDNTTNNMYSYTFASWLVRAQYSYKGRYMLSASVRGDASSRFAPNTRWGYFPAASIGWRLSDEPFMSGTKGWLTDMKVRASVGQTGNAQIGNSEYLALYGTGQTNLGNGVTNVMNPTQIANNDLGWEKNTQYNLGLDMNLWNGLISFNADAYYSRTTDMLFDVPVPALSGHTKSRVNIGSMENKGVELTMSHYKKIGDFSYGISANWSLNRNKVLSLGDEDAPIILASSYSGAYYITQVGQPIGCYYLLAQAGIFHNEMELASYPHFDSAQVGDFRFIDADGDGVMEEDQDRVIVGNYMPDFYYGASVNLGYKSFDLVANFQGVYGNEVLNLERRYLCSNSGSQNLTKEALNRYPYGNGSRANRKGSGNTTSCSSTYHLQDGSYFRLQNLSIGYNFPKRVLKNAKISDLRLYLQGTNLFTLTYYTGYNPETNKHSDDALRPGEGYWSYPLSRTFTVGLSFNM